MHTFIGAYEEDSVGVSADGSAHRCVRSFVSESKRMRESERESVRLRNNSLSMSVHMCICLCFVYNHE